MASRVKCGSARPCRHERGVPRKSHIGEKDVVKGHRDMPLVRHRKEATVECIGKVLKQTSPTCHVGTLPKERLETIEAISLRMWPDCANACRDKVPGADGRMALDHFRLLRRILDAVGYVTRREHQSLLESTDTTLSKRRFLCPTKPSSMPPEVGARFHELKATELFSHDLPNVPSYFAHRVAKAFTQGLSSKITIVPARTCGCRNPNRIKIAVCFNCANPDQYANAVTQPAVGRTSSCLPFRGEYRTHKAIRMTHLSPHNGHHLLCHAASRTLCSSLSTWGHTCDRFRSDRQCNRSRI